LERPFVYVFKFPFYTIVGMLTLSYSSTLIYYIIVIVCFMI
jgi:hypothetical protein